MIVPCFNEERLIKSKIKNLLSLDYPANKLNFVFVDGGSTDKTTEAVRTAASRDQRIKLVKTNLRNKIGQINQFLPKIRAEIVVISDVDTELDIKAIKNMGHEFNTDYATAVVGAYTRPKKTMPLDALYWQRQNQIRLLESKVLSSSIVIANCYGFRKSLLPQFPEDVVADDIFTAFLAQSKGLRVIYTDKALAYELRAPQNFSEFFQHKFRKAHAYIKEVLRFFPKSIQGNWRWKLAYLTKLIQVILNPLLVLVFFLSTIRLLLLGNFFLPIIFILALFLFTVLTSLTLRRIGREKEVTPGVGLTTISFILVNLFLFFALLGYPFYRQTACYRKINQEA